MTRVELLQLVGKKVKVYFKDSDRCIYGTLGFAKEFSEKYGFRKPNYFYIGNTSFKVSYIRKIDIDEDIYNDIKKGKNILPPMRSEDEVEK